MSTGPPGDAPKSVEPAEETAAAGPGGANPTSDGPEGGGANAAADGPAGAKLWNPNAGVGGGANDGPGGPNASVGGGAKAAGAWDGIP